MELLQGIWVFSFFHDLLSSGAGDLCLVEGVRDCTSFFLSFSSSSKIRVLLLSRLSHLCLLAASLLSRFARDIDQKYK